MRSELGMNSKGKYVIRTCWMILMASILHSNHLFSNTFKTSNTDSSDMLINRSSYSVSTETDAHESFRIKNPAADSIARLINSAQNKKDLEKEAMLWIELGNINSYSHHFKEADSAFGQALQLISDSDLIAQSYINLYLADNFLQWGKYKQADLQYNKAKALFESTNCKSGFALALHGLARTSERLGDYADAIGLMHRARECYLNVGDMSGLAALEFDLGDLFEKWNKFQVATEHYQLANQYYIKQNDNQKLAQIKIKLGQIDLKEGRFNEAHIHFMQVQNMDSAMISGELYGLVLINLGKVYERTGNIKTALIYYNKAIHYYQMHFDNKGLVESLQLASILHVSLTDYQSATNEAERSIDISENDGLKEYQMNGWLIMSKISAEKKEYDMAYRYLTEYNRIKNELFSETSTHLINEIAVKYETENIKEAYTSLKEKNEETKSALEKQKNEGSMTLILATFIVLVALIIIISIVIRTRENRRSYALQSIKNKKISDQKEILSTLNLKLSQSREQYRSIVENATIGMYQSTPKGQLKFANSALKNMLRYPPGYNIGLVNLNESCANRSLFISSLETYGKVTEREDSWIRLDGSQMEVNESAWVVKGTSDETLYYEGVVEDITRRKEVEKALKESQQKQEKLNRELIKTNKEIEKAKNVAIAANEVKSIFLANVSHEIRTPMNSIIGFSEIVSSITTDKQQKYYINAIKSSSSNLLSLLNDILDLSKIQSGEIEIINESVSLQRIAEDVMNIFQLRAKEKRLKMTMEFDADFPNKLILDGVRLRQVLINLVGNAIKFTEEGSVNVRYSFVIEDNTDYCTIHIQVSDTGIGIIKEELHSIFEAFKQSKSLREKAYGGTGLGLSISKQLIDLMGGTIHAESEPGKGSVFKLKMPHIRIENSIQFDTNSTSSYEKYSDNNSHSLSGYLELTPALNTTIPEIPLEIKDALTNTFGENWQRINNNHFMSELNEFAQKLITFAETSQLSWLIDFGKELEWACNQFDIDKIEQLMSELKNIFSIQSNKKESHE